MAESGQVERAPSVLRLGAPDPDAELLRAVREGSKAAAETLVARHWTRAYRIAFAILGDAHLAEDATQEAMISLLGSIGRFDARRRFEPWLHRIVANRALDLARVRSRREEVARVVELPPPEQGSDPDLVEALLRLPEDQRAVVVLRHVAGYGTNEIARMLGVRRGTVGSRLRRGLDQLRTQLEDNDG